MGRQNDRQQSSVFMDGTWTCRKDSDPLMRKYHDNEWGVAYDLDEVYFDYTQAFQVVAVADESNSANLKLNC